MTTLDRIELALRRAAERIDDRSMLSEGRDMLAYAQISESLCIVADEIRKTSASLEETETED